jgi:hypothetical protein
MTRDPATRFWEKVAVAGPDDCWEWTASKHRQGYGSFWDGERGTRAHRWAYEQIVGPIPDGLQLDHLCRNRACVNPVHLEPVTNRENVLRGDGPTAHQARQTHCKWGHELSPENTYRSPKHPSKRFCRRCFVTRRKDRQLPRAQEALHALSAEGGLAFVRDLDLEGNPIGWGLTFAALERDGLVESDVEWVGLPKVWSLTDAGKGLIEKRGGDDG